MDEFEPFRFGIAAESAADADWVSQLAQRALAGCIDWFDHDSDILRWVGIGDDEYLDVHHAKTRSRSAFGMRAYGRFDGAPAALEANLYRSILLLFQAESLVPESVVISRDIDQYPKRREGFEQAAALKWPFAVVGALPDPELEAWFVAGFDPEDDGERQNLARVREELSFSPVAKPERLTSKHKTDLRDAKRVCAALTGDDRDRRKRCFADLDRLRRNGHQAGLVAFIDAVEQRLAPILS